eukprot:6178368-Pleurochrysis_carterae.AAC.2
MQPAKEHVPTYGDISRKSVAGEVRALALSRRSRCAVVGMYRIHASNAPAERQSRAASCMPLATRRCVEIARSRSVRCVATEARKAVFTCRQPASSGSTSRFSSHDQMPSNV